MTVDAKGRVTIPARIREELGIAEGDTLVMSAVDGVVTLVKAEDPLDGLAAQAEAEHRQGRTQPLRTYAARRGITLDA